MAKRKRGEPAGIGDNSEGSGSDVSGIAQDHLRSFVERIERLEEEAKAIADDKKDVYAEAKGTGFDTKTLRKLISIRKMDQKERAEQEAMLDLYLMAVGMKPGTREEDIV